MQVDYLRRKSHTSEAGRVDTGFTFFSPTTNLDTRRDHHTPLNTC